MKIEHIAIYVKNIEQEKEFFEKYFNARSGALYENKTKGFSSYFLSFEDGARLEYVITDKNVHIQANKSLTGNEAFQVYVAKGQTV